MQLLCDLECAKLRRALGVLSIIREQLLTHQLLNWKKQWTGNLLRRPPWKESALLLRIKSFKKKRRRRRPNLSFIGFVEVALEPARTPPDVLFELSFEDFEADTPVVSRDVSVAPSEIVFSSDVSELPDVSEVPSSISPLFLSPFVLSPLDSPEYQPSGPAEVSEGSLESSSSVEAFFEKPVHAAVEPEDDEAGPSAPRIVVTETTKGKPLVSVNGYKYIHHSLSRDRTTQLWRCPKYGRPQLCKARAKSIASSTDLTLTATQDLGHNHPLELAAVAVRHESSSKNKRPESYQGRRVARLRPHPS
ncbi:hypothetical protein L596_030934 [Steinernema carpocapsae]|uniref:FLYWCH-type domain-containing protein n=1 Tax=Steinernema carpocapsae TaxID=34508 RepID=A0A4U5MHC7_STECR|nr:hypothetical protein L596_030934 [Steinernema carpocapsae]